MTAAPDDDRPSPKEVRRRIEVALADQHVENASEIATIAAAAIQPLVDGLKSHRASATVGAEFISTVSQYVRSHPPSDLRSSLIAVLRDLEPWNGEWVRLAHEGP